ncbi:MAG: TonB-dependent receptor [Rubrivivax sp.]|nr:TonB-dependent receptor [Rubrivivax sp.]
MAPEVEGSPRTLELTTDLLNTRFVSDWANHVFTLGAQYIDADMTDGLWGGNSNSLAQFSVYAEDEWSLTRDLAVTGGLRYDDNDAFGGQWTPRAHLVWRASEQWTFKGGVARGYRTPYLEQLTDGVIGFGNQGTVPIYGNPNLQPETSTNIEAGALYQGASGLRLQATVFHNRLDNLVEAGTGANAGTSLNIGEAVVKGLEMAGSFAFSRDVVVSANYSWTDSEVTQTQLDTGNPAQLIASRLGDPLVSVPEHQFNAKLDWQALPRLGTFLMWEYRSSAFRPRNYHEPQTGGNSQGQVAPGVRDSNVVLGDFQGYSLFTLGLNYAFTEHVSLQAAIYNLLDKDFNDYRDYTRCANGGCTTSATGSSNVYNNLLEPRRLWLALNVGF